RHRALGALLETVRGELAKRKALLARRCEPPCDIEMRPDAQPRGRVVGADVGAQEQQQQGSSLRRDVGAPRKEVVVIGAEARVDMPAGIARVDARWEANGKRAEIAPRHPAPRSDELV